MKVSYRREMKHNYMIIDPEGMAWRSYECQMMESNAIEGLLRFQVRQSDGEIQFHYEITSRQPLGRLLDNRTVTGEEIRKLVIGISNILDQIERFLLSESSILLKPEYIYVEPESFRVWLCLVPGMQLDFPEAYGDLLEYILGKVNHQDKDSVVLAYGLYQETRKENYGMEDILRLLQQNSLAESYGSSGADDGRMEKGQGSYEEEDTEEPGIRVGMHAGMRAEARAGMRSGMRNEQMPRKKKLWARIKAFFTGHRQSRREEEPVQLPWQAMFLEEEPRVDTAPQLAGGAASASFLTVPASPAPFSTMPVSHPASLAPVPPTPLPASDFEPTGQGTVLLSDISPKEVARKLRALDSGEADISLSYYPFIIGKQENLADYILNHETVSRLHLRIDRMGEDYQIMDLNSTNGTVVRGRLLENNESVPLHPGDEVQIARYRYRFE